MPGLEDPTLVQEPAAISLQAHRVIIHHTDTINVYTTGATDLLQEVPNNKG